MSGGLLSLDGLKSRALLCKAVLYGCLGVAGLRLLLSLALVPIPLYDSPFFLVTAHRFANGLGLTNPLFDEKAGGLFLWHGWLFPWLLGLFPSSQAYAGVLFAPTLLGLAATAVLFVYLRRRTGPLALALPAILALNLSFVGRPETLAALLLAAVPFLLPRFHLLKTQAILAVLLGLIALAHPVGALLCVPLILLAHGVYRSTLGFFARAMLVFAVVSPLTIALLTESLMPFSALDWLKGLMGHGALIAARTDSAGFGRYYIADPDAPVVILLFGLMALTGLALAARLGPALFPKLLYSAALVLWCAGLWYFGLRIPALCYNVKLFGPLLLVAAACLRPMLPLHGATTLRVIQLALAGACCGSLAYTSLVDAMSYRTGVPASALQAAVAPLAKSTARIGLPFAFAGPVSEILEPDRIEITWNAPFDTAAPLLLLRQAGTGETGLPAFPEGWRLVTSRFHKEPLRLFGITLKRARPDWAFALLCRSEICAEFDQPRRPL